MSYKTKLFKIAFDKTPKKMILWATNKKLKGVGELTDFNFDAEERKLYAQIQLEGEQEGEAVEIWLEDLNLITKDDEQFFLVARQAKSSRPWVDALLNNVIRDREWKVPNKRKELITELFEFKTPEPEE